MERLTYFDHGKYRLLFGGVEYSNEFVDRLAAYEDAEEAGRLLILPENADCDGECLLSCGDCGSCSVTGYPPNPDECREIIREMAEAALGGDKR